MSADCNHDRSRERGPLTVAAFMDLALYHPSSATTPAPPNVPAARAIFLPASMSARCSASCSKSRSPRWRAFSRRGDAPDPRSVRSRRSGAGNGRLVGGHPARAQRGAIPTLYGRIAAASRRSERRRSGRAGAPSSATLPIVSRPRPTSCPSVRRRALANELLDAMPVHQVVMRADGLREVYVTADRLIPGPVHASCEGPPSTPALAEYLDRLDVTLEPGWRVEINLRARDWMSRGGAAGSARLRHPDRLRPRSARALLGVARRRHADDVRAAHDQRARVIGECPPWLRDPASRTSPRTSTSRRPQAAEAEG